MFEITTGDAVRVKSLKVQTINRESLKSDGWANFNAGRGKRFVVLLLAIENEGEQINEEEALRKIGWNQTKD